MKDLPGTSYVREMSGPELELRRTILAHDAWRSNGLGDKGWMVLHLQRSGAALPDGSSGILAALDAAGLNAALDDTELLRRLKLFALDAGPGLYNSGWRDGMNFFYERRQKQAARDATPADLICAEEGR